MLRIRGRKQWFPYPKVVCERPYYQGGLPLHFWNRLRFKLWDLLKKTSLSTISLTPRTFILLYISQCFILYLTINARVRVEYVQFASLNTWFREFRFDSQFNRLPERYGSSVDLSSGVACIRIINDVHPHLGNILGTCSIDNGRGGDRSGTFGRFITAGRKRLIINIYLLPSSVWALRQIDFWNM